MELSAPEIRALQALRAPGGMTVEQAWARWPASGARDLNTLVRRGLAARDGETFTITEAGRASCPFNNPLLAELASQPKENIMPKGAISRTDVFNAILAAGPSGITRKALSEKLGVPDNIIDNHVGILCNAETATVQRPRRGMFVASQFSMPACGPSPEILAAVDTILDALPKLGAGAVPASATAPFSEGIDLGDPEQVEFAIFSSGRLDMYTDQGNIAMSKSVLLKLRAFLGLFAEAA